MANLYFTVETDYTKLTALIKEINSLEQKLKNVNLVLTPQVDVTMWQNQLAKAKGELNTLVQAAAQAGASIGNAIQAPTLNINFRQAMGGLNGYSNAVQRATSLGITMAQGMRNARGQADMFAKAMDGAADSTGRFVIGMKNFIANYTAANLALRGLYSAVGLIGEAKNTIMSFQTANSQLKAILGATDEQMQGFKDTAEELGRKTVFTASQVTELQIALSKLGFSASDIHAMEEPVLHFAQATGASLDEAASTTGAALRMFGVAEKDYEEMAIKYTNAMASATMSSALDFRMIRDNLATFGPMAHSIGLNIEDVLALFGKLKDSGVEASTAMTSLRNIFTKVAQGKIEGMENVHSLDEFVAGLEKLKNLDTGKGMKLIGPRGGTQFITLIQESQKILELRDRISTQMNQDTTGGMSANMTNNLAGSIKMLQSAWEGFILTFQESDGIAKDFIDNVTEGIGKLRELVAGAGDWSREEIESVIHGAEALIGVIATYKALRLGESVYNGVSMAFNSSMQAQEVALAEKMTLEMQKQAGIQVEMNTQKATAQTMAAEQLMLIRAQLEAEREQAVLEIKKHATKADASQMAELAVRDAKIAKADEELLTLRKQAVTQAQIVAECEKQVALNASKGNIARLDKAEAKAILIQEKIVTAENQKQVLLKEKQVTEDALLEAHGKQRLTTERIVGVEMGKNIGKASKFKAVMAMTGLDMLANPYVLAAAAIAAVGYGLYKIITYEDEATKLAKEYNKEIAKVNSDFEKNASKEKQTVKADYFALNAAAPDTKVYKDAYDNLCRLMKEYGISAENEKETLDSLNNKRDELIAKMEQEKEIRREIDVKTKIGEVEDKSVEEAKNQLAESLEKLQGGGAISASLVGMVDEKSLADYKKIMERIEELKHPDLSGKSLSERKDIKAKNGNEISQLKKQAHQLVEANVDVERLGKAMGYTASEIRTMQTAYRDYFRTISTIKDVTEDVSEANWRAAEAQRKANYEAERLSSTQKQFAERARLSKMSVKDLNDELAHIAKKYKIELELTTKVEDLPQWMKTKFNVGNGKETQGTVNALRKNASFHAERANNGNLTDAQRKDHLQKAQQYGLAADYAQQEVDKRKSEAEEKAKTATEEKKNAEKDAKASAENDKLAREKALRDMRKEREAQAERWKKKLREIEKDIAQCQIDAMLKAENEVEEAEKKIGLQRNKNVNDRIADLKAKNEDAVKALQDEIEKLWNIDPDHKERKAKDEKKDKNGKVKSAGVQGRGAVEFDKNALESGTGEFAKGGKYYEDFLNYKKKKIALNAQLNAQLIAEEAKSFKEVYETYKDDEDKRAQEIAKLKADLKALDEIAEQNRNNRQKNEEMIADITDRSKAVDEKEREKKKRIQEVEIQLQGADFKKGEKERLSKELQTLKAELQQIASEKIELDVQLKDANLQKGIIEKSDELSEKAKDKIALTLDNKSDNLEPKKIEYLKQYGDKQQQLQATELEHIKRVNDLRIKGANEWEKVSEEKRYRKEKDEVVANNSLEEIKKDPNYLSAMEDPQYVTTEGLDTLYSKLKDAKAALTDLPPDQLQAIADLMNKISEEVTSRNPFKTWKEGVKEMAEAKVEVKDTAKEFADAQKQVNWLSGLSGEESKAYYESELKGREQEKDIATNVREQAEQDYANAMESGTAEEQAEAQQRVEDALAREREAIIAVTEAQEDLNRAKQGIPTNKLIDAQDKLTKSENRYKNALNKEKTANAKVKKSRAEVGKSLSSLGSAMNDLGEQVNEFGGDVGRYIKDIGNMVSSVGAAMTAVSTVTATSISTIEKASAILAIISAAIQLATAAADLIGLGKDDSGYENAKGEYEELISIWDELISKKKEYLSESWGSEIKEVGKEIERIYNNEIEATRTLAQERLGAGASVGSHSYGYRMNRDLKGYYDKIGISDIRELTMMSGEQLQKIKEDQSLFWAKLDGDFQEYLEKIIECDEAIKENDKAMREQVAQMSFDDMYGNFVDTLMDMEASASDFTDDLTEKFTKALISNEIGALYKDKLQQWYDDYSKKLVDSGGKMSQAEVEKFRKRYEDMVQEAMQKRDQIADLTGYKQVSEQEGTTKGFEGMSQDTADELNGRFTALQTSNEVIARNSTLLAERVDTIMSMMAEKANTALSKGTTFEVEVDNDTDNTENANVVPTLDAISDYIKKMYESVNDLSVVLKAYNQEIAERQNATPNTTKSEKKDEDVNIGKHSAEVAEARKRDNETETVTEFFDRYAEEVAKIAESERNRFESSASLSESVSLNASLQGLVSEIVTQRSIAEDTRNLLAQSYLVLQNIETNTGDVVEPIKRMADEMDRMRRQMEKL